MHLSENGPSTTLASLFYDAQSRRDELDRDVTGAITRYGYDPISRLELLTHDLDGAGTSHDAGFGFAFNPASQITTRVLANEAYEFALTNAVKSYTVNGRNQYTQVGGAAHTWDANGNLTSEGATSFGYDTENRLVSISGAKSGSLAYDPLGRLWQASTASGVVRFVYDGDRLIAEYSSVGTLLRRYVHGAGVDEPLVWYEGAAVSAAARRYLHTDHQGSVVAVSNASGAMQQIQTYDAYGVTAAANTLRFQYTGQAAIPDLGLLYYKARFYYPALGRFLQTDPIGYEDDNNLYAYVSNDPLNNIDPTGMNNCEVTNPDGTNTPIPNCVGDPNAPPTPVDEPLDEVAVAGKREKKHVLKPDEKCEGVKCVYDGSEPENAARIEKNGAISPVQKTPFTGTVCGESVVGQSFPPGAFSGARGAAHEHPNGTRRTPAAGDYSIPAAYGIANYNISSNSVMVTERAGGSPRIRVVEGAALSSVERRRMQNLVNSWMDGSCDPGKVSK